MDRYMDSKMEGFRELDRYINTGADLWGDDTALPEPPGFVALVGPAASGARALVGSVGGGDAWVLVPASPSPSALACTASSRMAGANRSRIAPLLTRRIWPVWVL